MGVAACGDGADGGSDVIIEMRPTSVEDVEPNADALMDKFVFVVSLRR